MIIHQQNRNKNSSKKITTVKEVWIRGLNLLSFSWFYFSAYSLVLFDWEDISNIQDCVSLLSKHIKFCQQYSTLHHIFNSLLGVWISWWNTVSHFDILLQTTLAIRLMQFWENFQLSLIDSVNPYLNLHSYDNLYLALLMQALCNIEKLILLHMNFKERTKILMLTQ